MAEYSPAKTGEYMNNSRHFVQKYGRVFVLGHYLFLEANSFPTAKLEENCELRRTDYVQRQISEHIFAPNWSYCLYYPSNLFRNASSFENWGIFNNYSPKWRWIVVDICRAAKLTTFTDTEVNNCFSIYHTSWITSVPKSNFICDNIPTKAILSFLGCSEVNST